MVILRHQSVTIQHNPYIKTQAKNRVQLFESRYLLHTTSSLHLCSEQTENIEAESGTVRHKALALSLLMLQPRNSLSPFHLQERSPYIITVVVCWSP